MGDTVSSDSVAQDQLRAFVERIERIESEIAEMNSGKSEIYAEAKGNGFDVKVLRKIIADRRKDFTARVEFETIYDLYAAALGMHATPYFDRDEDEDEPSRVHVHAHEAASVAAFTPAAGSPVGELGAAPGAIGAGAIALTPKTDAASETADGDFDPLTGEIIETSSHLDAFFDRLSGEHGGQTIPAGSHALDGNGDAQARHSAGLEEITGRSPASKPDAVASVSDLNSNTPGESGTAREASGSSAPSNGIAGLREGLEAAPGTNSPVAVEGQRSTPVVDVGGDGGALTPGDSGDTTEPDSGLGIAGEDAPNSAPAPLVVAQRAPRHNSDPRCLDKAACGEFLNIAFCASCRAAAGMPPCKLVRKQVAA